MRLRVRLVALLLLHACGSAAAGAAPKVAAEAAPPSTQAGQPEQVVHVTAQKFEFTPDVIRLKLHVPVVIELTSLDRRHGFQAPDFHVDEEIAPGTPTRVHLVPDQEGTFTFHCSVFCGSGHEDMAGQIVVEP